MLFKGVDEWMIHCYQTIAFLKYQQHVSLLENIKRLKNITCDKKTYFDLLLKYNFREMRNKIKLST